MKKVVLWCLFMCVWSVSYSANLYNLDNQNLSKTLEQINQQYNINIDVHILNQWDTCAERQDFSACLREEYDDGVDIIYAINVPARKMETSINDAVETIFPSSLPLAFEEKAVPGMQQWDTAWAVEAYLNTLTDHMKTTCTSYTLETCTKSTLTKAITLDLEQQAEDSAREKLKYTQAAFAFVLLSILALGGRSRWKTLSRDRNNKEHLNQLVDHTKFLSLTIEHDSMLHKNDKKKLTDMIGIFEKDLETLSTSKPSRLDMKLKETSYNTTLQDITQEYQDMLHLLGNSKEILAQVEKVGNIDI